MNDDPDLELDFHLEGDLEGDFAGDHERDMPGHYAAVVDADGRPVLDRVHGVVGARMRLDDWHALFAAVKTRLHGIATAPDLWARGPCDEQQPHPAAALVLECALALDSLHVQIRTGLAAEVPDMPSVQSPTSAQVQGVDAACAAGMDFARAPRLAGGWRAPLARTGPAVVTPDGTLAWMPGETFLRQRIAAEASRALARDSGFSLLRIEFRDLDAACAAHLPGCAPLHASPRALQQPDEIRERLLTAIAARLRGALRRQDVITQPGRNDFCCLLVDAYSQEGLEKYVFNVVSAVSLPFAFHGEQVHLQPLFGVASCPKDGNTADGLLRFAAMELHDLTTWHGFPELPVASLNPGSAAR